MSAMQLPLGAHEIVKLRRIGKAPAGIVLLSLIGWLRHETNHVVVAKPTHSYDWRFLVGLEVLVVANSELDPGSIRRVLTSLKALPTTYLGLWLVDRNNGVNFIVDGVVAQPEGSLRYMDREQRQQWADIGYEYSMEALCR